MTTWRIYRLPGSREWWHVDSGKETAVFNVRGFTTLCDCHSVDVGGDNVPRAWIEIDCKTPYPVELHIVNGWAVFEFPGVRKAVKDVVEEMNLTVNMSREGTGEIQK